MRFAPFPSWLSSSNSAEQSSNGHSEEAGEHSAAHSSSQRTSRKPLNGSAGRHLNGDDGLAHSSDRSERKRNAVVPVNADSVSCESQSMDDLDTFELAGTKSRSLAKRPRLFAATAEEQRPAGLGFTKKIGQFLNFFLPASSLDHLKNWVKGGSEPPNSQLLYSPLNRADMPLPSNGFNANGLQSRQGRTIPLIDLTEDDAVVSCPSSTEPSSRLSASKSPLSAYDHEISITPIPDLSSSSLNTCDDDDDVQILEDGAGPSASGWNSSVRLERHWDRHENAALKSQVRPISLRESTIRRPGTRSTPRQTLNFNRSDLTSRLGSVRTAFSESRQMGNRSLHQVINLEERERYREMLEKLGAGNVSFTPKNRTTRVVSPQTPSGSTSGDRHKALLVNSRNLLDELTADISSPRSSEDSSVVIVDEEDTTGASSVSISERPSPSAALLNRHRWSQEKTNELNRKLELDPSAVSKDIRDDFLPSTARRRQQALELKAEVQLREDARKHREKSYDDELRLRLRLEGLVIPEPEEEVDEFPDLPDEANALVERVWGRGDPNELFVEEYSQPIRRKDLLTLRGLEWLNDEVINFYMNLIMARSNATEKLPKVHAFVTFFYPKVAQGGHSSVKRWTRKVDIFSFDLLLVPIHLGAHWCLATVDFRKKRIEYYDSMGGKNFKCLTVLSEYLCAESLDKKKQPFDMSGWDAICLEDIPQQMNGSDCGMFACKFAEYASRGAKITFDQEHMPYFRRRMVYEICTNKLM